MPETIQSHLIGRFKSLTPYKQTSSANCTLFSVLFNLQTKYAIVPFKQLGPSGLSFFGGKMAGNAKKVVNHTKEVAGLENAHGKKYTMINQF